MSSNCFFTVMNFLDPMEFNEKKIINENVFKIYLYNNFYELGKWNKKIIPQKKDIITFQYWNNFEYSIQHAMVIINSEKSEIYHQVGPGGRIGCDKFMNPCTFYIPRTAYCLQKVDEKEIITKALEFNYEGIKMYRRRKVSIGKLFFFFFFLFIIIFFLYCLFN
jgi:hypothetical protein